MGMDCLYRWYLYGLWVVLSLGLPGARALGAAEDGFEPIFNGRDLDGWVIESHADSEVHPDGRPVWSVKEGEIDCDGLGFGFLRYAREPFADVTLRMEFRLGKKADGEPCNAGIGVRTGAFDRRRSRATRPSIRGYELQLLDDAGSPPSTHSSGSLYRYVAPRENAIRPAGEWNDLEVTLVGPRIHVVLNGRSIQDVDQETVPQIRTKPLSGFFSLQNHGGPARFRNLRVRREPTAAVGESSLDARESLDAQGSMVASRDPAIGIRGLLRYALEAAGRGWDPAAIEAGLELARSMQVVGAEEADRGNFRWRLGDGEVTDANACEFAGQLLALLRLEDDGRLVPRPGGRRLSPRGRELVDSMARDALTAIRRRRVEPGYTNIFLTHTWNLLALGDLAGPDAITEGEAAWREWLAFTRAHGVTEFVAPTYLGVDLDALALVADHAPSWETRAEAEGALGYLWRSAACHWLPVAQRLTGPHARDYDWLFGRGYADEHLVEAGWLTVPARPEGAGWLPGAPREGLHLFRTACRWEPPGSLLEDVVALAPRSIVERTGERPWQRITDWVGKSSSIGIAGEGRGAEDKTLVVNLPPLGWSPEPAGEPWRGANVTLVFDGRGDPYGTVHEASAAAPQAKPSHLRPYLVSSQQGARVTGLWLLDPRRAPFRVDPKTLSGLAAHLLLPASCEVWSVDGVLAPGAILGPDAVVFLRGAGTVLGVRYLAPVDADLRATGVELVADGGRQPVQRLTATFALGVPQRGALLGLDLELREGCDDEAFADFRQEFVAREVGLERVGTRACVTGSLPLELDLGSGAARPRRLRFEPVLPPGDLILLDRIEIGREALEPEEPR
jgi:hypothetical protein